MPGARDARAEVASFKREQIIEAAAHLFLRNGYHGCSLEAVAKSLGATKPYIYYAFSGKASLLTAICELGANLSLNAIVQAEALDAGPSERVRWFCSRLAEIVIEYGHYVAVYSRETNSLPDVARRAIIKTREEVDRRFSKQIAEGVSEGVFQVDDPLIAARAVTGMISYMQLWRRPSDSMSKQELTGIMTEIAMRTFREHREHGLPKAAAV